MIVDANLVKCVLIRRYKRFLADVELENGEQAVVHCPNSGSMKKCFEPGWRALISPANNPKRKLAWTLQFVNNGKSWIVVNTNLANELVFESISKQKISELRDLDALRREVPYGEKSRIDIFGMDSGTPCYIEVKSVTLLDDQNRNAFPDAVTARGQKHLSELQKQVENGNRAVMFFQVMREDGHDFAAASNIDPVYSKMLLEAADNGVEVLVYGVSIKPPSILVAKKLNWKRTL